MRGSPTPIQASDGLVPFGLHVVLVTPRPRVRPTDQELAAIATALSEVRQLASPRSELVLSTNWNSSSAGVVLDAIGSAGPARSSPTGSDYLSDIDRADAVVVLVGPARSATAEKALTLGFESTAMVVRIETVSETVGIGIEKNEVRVRLLKEASAHLDRFNRVRANAQRRVNVTVRQREWWGLSNAEKLPERATETADWVMPFFGRAETAALQYQRRFLLSSLAIFVLAAAGVALVAAQVAYFEEHPSYAWIEVGFLATLLGLYIGNLRGRLHEQWISYRFLTERLRSLYFLTLTDDGSSPEFAVQSAGTLDATETWIQRALREIVARRPAARSSNNDATAIGEYLAQYWIADQSKYHAKNATKFEVRDRLLVGTTVGLFFVTFVAAIFHATAVGHTHEGSNAFAKLVLFGSIAIPAIGAAIHGYISQRQFRRHADRYRRMVELLDQLALRARSASSLDELYRVALDVERVTREENADWFGVMRFEDMELIT